MTLVVCDRSKKAFKRTKDAQRGLTESCENLSRCRFVSGFLEQMLEFTCGKGASTSCTSRLLVNAEMLPLGCVGNGHCRDNVSGASWTSFDKLNSQEEDMLSKGITDLTSFGTVNGVTLGGLTCAMSKISIASLGNSKMSVSDDGVPVVTGTLNGRGGTLGKDKCSKGSPRSLNEPLNERTVLGGAEHTLQLFTTSCLQWSRKGRPTHEAFTGPSRQGRPTLEAAFRESSHCGMSLYL